MEALLSPHSIYQAKSDNPLKKIVSSETKTPRYVAAKKPNADVMKKKYEKG